MENIFELFTEDDEGDESAWFSVTQNIIKTLEKPIKKLHELVDKLEDKYEGLGLADTASREALFGYIQSRILNEVTDKDVDAMLEEEEED